VKRQRTKAESGWQLRRGVIDLEFYPISTQCNWRVIENIKENRWDKA